jgi:tetratricopeptide (TPR) repeat protein
VFVDVYRWIEDFQIEAVRNGDMRRLQLVDYQTMAWTHFETNPQQSLSILYQARELAEVLQEPCWVLYYNSWIGECLNLYLNDFKQGMAHAMQTVVEIRKPEYAKCTMLSRGYRIVIESYIYSDPVGYADKIRELIAYADSEIPIDYDTYCILKKRESELEFALGNIELAIRSALDYLRRSSEQVVTFHMMYAYEMLVHYSYLQGQHERAHYLILQSEAMARDNQRVSLVAITQAWRALFNLIDGQDDIAQTLYQHATHNMSQLGMAISLSYYEAVCAYNERIGDLPTAITMRDKQLASVQGKGASYLEAEALLKKARLLGRMGNDTQATLEQAFVVSHQLLKPQQFLQNLQRIKDGDFSETLRPS